MAGWRGQGAKGKGQMALLPLDCGASAEEACFLQRAGNLSGLSVGCISAAPRF